MRWVASAPTRICDAGGWTDTWFAKHGRVVNLAVAPRAVARVEVTERGDGEQVRIHVVDFGDDYSFDLADPPGRHPLLEQAVVAASPPGADRIAVEVSCAAPAGASMGTSASVVVALVAALHAAAHPGRPLSPAEAARRAHEVETRRVGRQAGVQDQLAAAFGGVCDIRMEDYPRAEVSRIALDPATCIALDESLVTVYLGGHDSSAVHRQVIDALEGEGPASPRLDRLRSTAAAAADALHAGDLELFGAALRANTDAQATLHPDVVGADAREAIAIAADHDALGWKVNGAGGAGGSVTVLCRAGTRPAVVDALSARSGWRVVDTRLSAEGVEVRRDLDPLL